MTKHVGVMLSGCGLLDGSEIHETTLTLYFLDRSGARIVCMAPDRDQSDVINHVSRQPGGETRNVLVESARIARGDIHSLADVKAADLDALIFPGGSGAARNLSDFAVSGSRCSVIPEVSALIEAMHRQKKPMGFICIAPVIAARVLGRLAPELTVGGDSPAARAIEEMGARHVICGVDGAVVDRAHKIVTTPAYMIGPTIAPVALGIEALVKEVLMLAER